MEDKLTWTQKLYAKGALGKAKRKIRRWIKKREEIGEERLRGKLINVIWSMEEMFEIKTEKQGLITSKELLETEETEELIDICEKIIEEAERNV